MGSTRGDVEEKDGLFSDCNGDGDDGTDGNDSGDGFIFFFTTEKRFNGGFKGGAGCLSVTLRGEDGPRLSVERSKPPPKRAKASSTDDSLVPEPNVGVPQRDPARSKTSMSVRYFLSVSISEPILCDESSMGVTSADF